MEPRIGKAEVPKRDLADLDFADLDMKADTPEGTRVEDDLQPNSLNFRLEPIRSKHKKGWDSSRVLKYFAMMLVVLFACSLTLRYVDEVREPAIAQVKQWAAKTKKKKIGKITVPVLSKVSLLLKAHRPVQMVTIPDAVTNTGGSCAAFIADAINKKLRSKLSSEEFLHVVNCELFQDSASIAQQTLQKSGITLTHGVTWDKLYQSLLVLETTRRLQPLSPLPVFPKQGCLRWAPSPDCVLRYVDEARLSYKSRWQDGFKALDPVIREKPALEKAWFYLATSRYATKDEDFAKSESFSKKSFDALSGENNPFLEREIYRNATISAFLSGDGNLVKKAKAYRPAAREEEDPRAFLDVNLLNNLPSPKGRDRIAEFLATSEAKIRFASDARFLKLVLHDTQIFGLQTEGLTFATSVFGRDPKVDTFGESLILMYARVMIGAGRGDEAIALLGSLESSGYRSAELHHLRGLAYLLPSKLKNSALMAAKEFQTAAGISKNEDSLFAMLVSLLGTQSRSKAEQVLQQWRGLGPQVQKSVWFAFAEGIILYNAGKAAEAKAAWTRGEKLSKNKEMWKTLQSNVQKDPTYFDRDVAASLKFMLPPESPLGSLALYGQKS